MLPLGTKGQSLIARDASHAMVSIFRTGVINWRFERLLHSEWVWIDKLEQKYWDLGIWRISEEAKALIQMPVPISDGEFLWKWGFCF